MGHTYYFLSGYITFVRTVCHNIFGLGLWKLYIISIWQKGLQKHMLIMSVNLISIWKWYIEILGMVPKNTLSF